MKQMLIPLILAAALLLTSCVGFFHKPENETETGGGKLGELLSFTYSPGYSDMDGESHQDRLERNGDGEWKIVSRNRNSFGEPMIVTTYSVSADAVGRFVTFLEENDVLSLEDRPDDDLFATDYSPWSYRAVFDNSAGGGDAYESCSIGEYKQYSERDYELLKELNRQFRSLFGAVVSETEETDGWG